MRFPTMWYVRQAKAQTACAYAQSDQSLCLSLECSMNIKLLTEHHLEFLSLRMGFRGLSESTLVKVPHCWKSHVTAQLFTNPNREFQRMNKGFSHSSHINPLLSTVIIIPKFYFKKCDGDIAIASVRPSRYLCLNHWTKSNQSSHW